jgi:hypothetical protein
MLKLYETCPPHIWFPQPVPEYQVIKSPSAVDVRSQAKFFSPVEGPREEEGSHFELILLAVLSTRSRSPAELGKSANILRWRSCLLVVTKRK